MLKTNNIEEKIMFDVPMKNYTSFKIGGKAGKISKDKKRRSVEKCNKICKRK